MPTFNLAPKPENLDPQWEKRTPQSLGNGTQSQSAGQARATFARRSEAAAGPLKPLAQFFNALASPDTKIGIVTGPINAVSKFGNAIGDLVQGKPIDVKDAWTISDKQARQINPWRLGYAGQEVTPSDEAGLAIGEGIGAELAGAATGATLLQQASKIRRLQQAAQALQKQAAVRRAAVAISASPKLTAATNVATNVGQAVGSAALATPFMDQADGNLANLGDAAGLKLPGRVEPDENYLQALAKSIAVEGVAAPLALMGLGAMIKPIREGMAKGGPGWIQDLANAELEPYLPKPMAGPALPAAADVPRLPGYQQQGGALVPFDSAITRSLQEQTQIKQVQQQRQRLQQMGLVQQGEGGQLELALGGAVDPEIRLQVRQLQVQRGQLIKEGMADGGRDVSQDLARIDQEIGDLIQSGRAMDPMDARPPVQPELDLPDGRPELDTYLANLDELDDAQLRDIHSRVWRAAGEQRNGEELVAAQQKVQAVEQRMTEIVARQAAGDITPVGAKRMTAKAQKELVLAQQQVEAINARGRVPEALVGDQLQLRIEQQGQLDLTPEVKLPPLEQVTRTASEYGYQTPDDYRSALGGWNRDQLRRLAMPDSSPEVAALVKARTGRRVWQAKKQDIIDALVEIAERRGRFLPPEPTQLALELKANQFGDAAPLFDRPADLSVPGMTKVLDADGVEQIVPATDYSGRGMDLQTRERLKAEILQRAIDNGEVQPPISPLPQRPTTAFEQGSLVDELFADPTGQLPLAFSTDVLPTYKAGGKNADAWIEEMRLRLEYDLLDEQAQRAQQQALMAAHGWDTLTWEERKRLGILGEGFYSLQRHEFAGAVDRLRQPTAQFNPELEAVPPRQPKRYRMESGGQIVEDTPAVKPTPAEAAAAKKEQAAAARISRAEAKKGAAAAEKQIQTVKKRLDEVTRKHQGGKC